MTHYQVACLLLVATASLGTWAQGLESPQPRRADRWERYQTADGKAVLTCLYSFLLPPRGGSNLQGEHKVDHHRALCQLQDGTRVAWFFRFELGGNGSVERLLADVERGHWLLVQKEIAVEPRQPGETWESWKSRILDADPKLTTIRIETNLLRLAPFRESQADETKPRIWRELKEGQPELASFLQKLVTEIGRPAQANEGIAASVLVAPIVAEVYGGPEPSLKRFAVKVEKCDSEEDDKAVRDFERGFGQWASWPEPPRLKR
ncbi:hypothetical protein HRbin09_01985 [bacterium HR09]|nr:hypothetical protein HRbin09_01985 [bacterium HR09]